MTIHWFCGKPPWPSFENSRGEIQNQHRDFSISPMESQSRTASFHPTRLGSPYRWCKIVPGQGLLAAHQVSRRADFAPYDAGTPLPAAGGAVRGPRTAAAPRKPPAGVPRR